MTFEALPGCRGPKGDPCADGKMDLFPLTPLYAIGWAVVASLLVYLVFALLRRTDAFPVVRLGCGFWVLLWIGVVLLGVSGGGFGLVLVPVIAYGLAAVVIVSRPE